MPTRGQNWKKWFRWGLGALLALDALLLLVAWRTGRERDLAEGLKQLRVQHKLLGADVGRAHDIRNRLPDVEQQCKRFYVEQFRPAAGGYSAVVEDLAEIAKKSGLRTSAVNYKQQVVEEHGVIQIDVSTTVEGDYAHLVRFINGLERSKNFFLLRDLSLVSSTTGLKLNLELRTYFRS